MTISKKLRFEILKRDNFKCVYCGNDSRTTTLDVDHIIPRSKGGGDSHENLVTACFACNVGKASTLNTNNETEKACILNQCHVNKKANQCTLSVLHALIDQASTIRYNIFPISSSSLSEKIGFPKQQVSKSLSKLEADGLIIRHHLDALYFADNIQFKHDLMSGFLSGSRATFLILNVSKIVYSQYSDGLKSIYEKEGFGHDDFQFEECF